MPIFMPVTFSLANRMCEEEFVTRDPRGDITSCQKLSNGRPTSRSAPLRTPLFMTPSAVSWRTRVTFVQLSVKVTWVTSLAGSGNDK